MKNKTETTHTSTTIPRVSEVTDKAMKNFEHALRTGVKLQEEAARCWTTVLNQSTSAHDWQKQIANYTNVANGVLPATQKQIEGVMDLMEKNTRTSVELIKKAIDAAQSPSPTESQNKWLDVYTSSLGAVRSTTEAVAQLNAQAIDSCINYLRRTNDNFLRASKNAA